MKFLRSWRIRKPEEDNESVYLSEKFGVRTLHIGSDTVQSSMRIAQPNDLEISYTRSMMAFLLFNADPREVLMVGLGGGSLAKYVYHRLPRARTTVVEIMPQVVAAWCEQQGHKVTFICFTGHEDLFSVLPDGVDLIFIGAFTESALEKFKGFSLLGIETPAH